MSDELEDPDTSAERLEVALERIATLSAARPAVQPPAGQQMGDADAAKVDRPDADLSIPEIAERLDSLIVRLRAALGGEWKP